MNFSKVVSVLFLVFVATFIFLLLDSNTPVKTKTKTKTKTYKVEVIPKETKVKCIHKISVSAYTSSKEECGNDLGITASGKKVAPGIVACNFLPLGTKIRIPEMFGDRVFTVYDRMASDRNNHVDIYVKHVKRALLIGRSSQTIEVLETV